MREVNGERFDRIKDLAFSLSPEEAGSWDIAQEMPRETVARLGASGLLGCFIPKEMGGAGWDALSFGMLCSELGGVSLSLVSIVTVHSMFLEALRAWGTAGQKDEWLARMISGEAMGAFALTEPDRGSDAVHIQTEFVEDGAEIVITGRKKWISYAQRADVFLVFGQLGGSRPSACIVPRSTPGLEVRPMRNLLGFRAAMLGEITFDHCRVPLSSIVGRPGNGFTHVANCSLDLGRFAVAFGCLGCMEACTSDSVSFAKKRMQFDKPLMSHQLIQEMISDMITSVKAARQLCRHAAGLRDALDPSSIVETTVAKYFTSRAAVEVAGKAVQIHGAIGCSADEGRIERFYRDARIGEIVEGSNQMQQLMIARSGSVEFLRARAQRNQAREGK